MAKKPPPPAAPAKFDFHYQKTPLYRGVHADGFWGGPTPRGSFAVSFFSERQPLPKVAQREMLSTGDGMMTLGPESVSEVLSGVVRQVEVTVYMDLRAVQEFYEWLGMHVAKMEEQFGVPLNERVGKLGAEASDG